MNNRWNFQIDLQTDNQSTPIYLALVEAIQRDICCGILKEGEMLPSSREMASQLGLSRKTIVKAMEILQLKGFLLSKDRVGLFVANPSSTTDSPIPKDNVSLKEKETVCAPLLKVNDGFPDTRLLPFLEFTRAYRKLFNRAAQWKSLGYNEPTGYPKFRQAIATMLSHSRSLAISDQELCVVRGSQMALYLVAHAVLQRGDRVAMESPGYQNAYDAFQAADLTIHAIPVDEEGIDVTLLEELCQSEPIRAVYLTPRHQYPTTVKLSLPRRRRIKELSEKYDFIVIEDDFGADFQFSGQRLLPISSMLDKAHTIYIGTFSKIFAPAIRVGYVISSTETIRKIAAYRQLIDIQGDTVQERALCEMMESGVLARHIRHSMKIYRERLAFATQEIQRVLGTSVGYRPPHGGLALWLTLPEHLTEPILRTRLAGKGISIPIFHLTDGRMGVRIGYASLTKEELSRVIEEIRRAL